MSSKQSICKVSQVNKVTEVSKVTKHMKYTRITILRYIINTIYEVPTASQFPTAGLGGRGLWGRDWVHSLTSQACSAYRVPNLLAPRKGWGIGVELFKTNQRLYFSLHALQLGLYKL